MPAQRETVVLSAQSQGTVAPKREIELVAVVAGQVVKVEPRFENGAFFDRGELLIEIDDRDYQSAYQGSQARMAQARRHLAEEEGRATQAGREWRDLGDSKANELFLRKPQLAEARANLVAAEADLRTAKLNLDRTKIRAPFDGRIREIYVDLGQYVSRGVALAKVYDTSAAEIRLPLSDRQLAMLDLPLGLRADDGPSVRFSATIAGREHQWQGRVTRTDASVDTRSRMYYAIAEVDNPFKVSEGDSGRVPLMPGLFVSAEIAGKQLADVLVLPRESLVRREYIYLLGESNTITAQHVTVLKKDLERVWLRGDFKDGSLIVLDKHALVSPGAVVEPVREAASSDAAGIAQSGE
jgi:RND family efflux transporter MFP subunit